MRGRANFRAIEYFFGRLPLRLRRGRSGKPLPVGSAKIGCAIGGLLRGHVQITSDVRYLEGFAIGMQVNRHKRPSNLVVLAGPFL